MSSEDRGQIEAAMTDLRVKADVGVNRGRRLTFKFDGEPLSAYEGETVAATLIASGIRVLRTTADSGETRGVFCGMGVCYDCLMIIDDQLSRRACMVPVADGMDVRTQHGPGDAGGHDASGQVEPT